MAIKRFLRVNGAEYEQAREPRLAAGLSLYAALVYKGEKTVPVYSRTKSGPFVFQFPHDVTWDPGFEPQ